MATKKVKPTEKNVIAVIELMEAGETERSACEAIGLNRSTFRSAVLRHKVADHYARALEGLAQAQAEALETTIEDMRSGKIDAQMARVEIDARKWFASKFLPKRYGDKIDVTSDGKQIGKPLLEGLVDAEKGKDE